MSFSPEQIESLTQALRQSLGEDLPWKFEPRTNSMLSEFAQNKSERVLSQLSQALPDEWQQKTARKIPVSIKKQLGDLAKLSKQQMLLARPCSGDMPTLVALWWPWGHGGTYSLRLILLNQSYQTNPSTDAGFVSKIKRLFAWS